MVVFKMCVSIYLGPKAKEQLLQLIATLLVLQVIRFKLGGLVFKSLVKLHDSFKTWYVLECELKFQIISLKA